MCCQRVIIRLFWWWCFIGDYQYGDWLWSTCQFYVKRTWSAGRRRTHRWAMNHCLMFLKCDYDIRWMLNWRVLCEWSAGGEAGDADGTDAGGGGVTSTGSGPRMKISSRKRHSLANKPQDFQVHRNVSLRCVVFSFTISVQGILCFIVTLRSVCGWSRAVSCLVITSDLWWRFTCVQKLTEHASRKEIIPTLMRYL